jgi:hypothetical protein
VTEYWTWCKEVGGGRDAWRLRSDLLVEAEVLLDAHHPAEEFLVLARGGIGVQRVLNTLDFHFHAIDSVSEFFLNAIDALIKLIETLIDVVEALAEDVHDVGEHGYDGIESLAVGFFHAVWTSLYFFRTARMGAPCVLQSSIRSEKSDRGTTRAGPEIGFLQTSHVCMSAMRELYAGVLAAQIAGSAYHEYWKSSARKLEAPRTRIGY